MNDRTVRRYGIPGAGRRLAVCAALILHTGQHHDAAMFGDLLADLGLPAPGISLGVSGGSHAELTGRTMIAAEAAWQRDRPAMVVVAGDVDGALAAGLAARKLRIPLAHLEAGLRCGDADMPEEINRRAIDAISDVLWAPDEATAARLRSEGHAGVRAVGNLFTEANLGAHLTARSSFGMDAALNRSKSFTPAYTIFNPDGSASQQNNEFSDILH
jgi:UDP-N-acetylglucosamine 2-epimerase (non-hydrolysing)